MANSGNTDRPHDNEFSREASSGRTGLAAEFWDFLKHNKKWWLLPIVLAIVGIGVLIVMSPAAAPFIYPLF